ncbi:unnamed protein product [Clavelina lepadiformis]|uniref:Protein phosphatase 1 regulatory subunit 36 n=1 Tax=Clavelina lepadiformis TaxID=159417 RepID=A0ABP0H099_CLALP
MVSIPIHKGHYEWNSQANILEFVSDFGMDGIDRKKRSRGNFGVIHLPNFLKDRATPSKSMHGLLTSSGGNPGANGRLVGRGTGHRTSPRLGVFRNDNSNVTLYDVKSVALSHLESEREILKVSPYFRELFDTNQFDKFLITLLQYFNYFIEGIEQQKRPHKTSYLEPSKAEIQAMLDIQKQLAVTKKHLGQAYCVLLLGIGLEKQHHMGCGKQRVSSTHRDKKMYEDLYEFCTILIWITFRRREYARIRMEVGDMLRSSIYNPAIRRTRHESSDSEANKSSKQYIRDPSKPIAERVEELLSVKLPQVKKLTPAQHRRQYGRRPAIMKAIHQRSSAVVSLLPLPHEEAEHLFKSAIKMQNEQKGQSANKPDLKSESLPQEDFYPLENIRVGIIGEPMDLFNPENLLPKNMDNEDDSDSRDDESAILRSNVSQHSHQDLPKHRTLSRTTTEDSIGD